MNKRHLYAVLNTLIALTLLGYSVELFPDESVKAIGCVLVSCLFTFIALNLADIK